MEPPAYRTMGLAVPVTDALDARLWRDRYAYGLILGVGERSSKSAAVDRVLGCQGRAGKSKTAAGRAEAAAQSEAAAYADQLSNSVIRWQLKVALSELEIKLGIPFGVLIRKGTPVDSGLVRGVDYDQEVPRLPMTPQEQLNYFRIDLPPSVISVERVRAYWFDQLVWTITPGESSGPILRFEHPGTSSLHLMPTTGTSIWIGWPTGGPPLGAMSLLSGLGGNVPDVWSVDYTMGPRSKYGQIGEIEAAIAHWVYCKAGKILYSIAGMAASRGITSASLSIDGLSKSVSLANQGAIFKAVEDRLEEAEKSIDWKALRAYKRGLRVRGYG